MLFLYAAAFAALPDDLAAAVSLADCATVLQRLSAPDTPDERLVAGRCQVDRGLPLTVDLEGLTGVHGDYGRLVRARAAAGAEDWATTAGVLQGLVLPGPAGQELQMLRGRAQIGQGQSLEARPDLRALLDTDAGAEARYWLAVGGADRGDLDAARATFERTWATSWTGPWAERSASKLQELGSPVPSVATERGRQLVRDRIATLKQHHQYPDALELLLLLDPEPLVEARARFRAREYTAADALYRRILGPPDEAKGAPDDLFRYALGSIRGPGDYEAAHQIYARLIALHPNHPKAQLAFYKQGYTAYDEGDCAAAVPLLEQYVERYPGAAQVDEALWFVGRCHHRVGEVDAARSAWDHLVRARPKSSLVVGAAYWKARTGPDPEAGLRDLVRRWPTSGYAWFAAEHLGMEFPGRTLVDAPPWPEELAARSEVARAEALLGMGLKDWARAELAPIVPAVRGRRASAVPAAWALIEAGDYVAGRNLVKSWCAPAWEEGDPVIQQACFPRPEHGVVAPLTARYELPSWLPYGIMKAESAMKPGVTSIAGARGLMQLMPAEADRVHRTVYADDTYHPDRLYSAPYNASLGTAELGLKQGELGAGLLQTSSLPAVIASYNGGAEAVRRWRSGYAEAPPMDEFAEDIGYSETRRYVKRVLGYAMAYRWVYGDG